MARIGKHQILVVFGPGGAREVQGKCRDRRGNQTRRAELVLAVRPLGGGEPAEHANKGRGPRALFPVAETSPRRPLLHRKGSGAVALPPGVVTEIFPVTAPVGTVVMI